jgi:transposase-like protein
MHLSDVRSDDPKPVTPRRLEVYTGSQERRRWPDETKARIVLESFVAGTVVTQLAQRHGCRPQQIHDWRRLARTGKLALPAPAGEVIPAFVPLLPETSTPAPAAPVVQESSLDVEIAGATVRVLGGVARRLRFERVSAIEAALGVKPDPIFRLAALAVFVEEDAERLGEKLRLSSAEASELRALAQRTPPAFEDFERLGLEALLYRIGPRLYLGRLLLAWAKSDAAEDDPAWKAAAQPAAAWQRPKFPISGADLIALGWKPGPALGEKLKYLEDFWIAEGFRTSREELLALARQSR